MPIKAIIDYPGGLNYLISKILIRLGGYGEAAWTILGCIFVIAVLVLSLGNFYLPLVPSNKFKRFLYSPFFFSLVIAIGIIVLRIPNLIFFELNPDESHWMVGAATLQKDPRFWISVNGGTSGPLVIFPLIIINLLGGSINYATVRLFGLLFCAIPSVLLIYFSFSKLFSDKISRLIILPLVVCMAFASHFDLISYNSEHIPLLLVSLCIFFYSNMIVSPKKRLLNLCLLALMLGCIPYSKLQTIPIAFSIACFCAFDIFAFNKNTAKKLIKELIYFLAFGSLPTFIILTYVCTHNIFYDFWRNYIIFNFTYAAGGIWGIGLSLTEKFSNFYLLLLALPDTRLYFISLLVSGCVAIILLRKFKICIASVHRRLILLSFVTLIAAAYSTIQPGNFFTHYQIFLLVPMSLFSGIPIGILNSVYLRNSSWTNDRFRDYLIVFVIISVIIPSIFGVLRGSPGFKFITKYKAYAIQGVKSKVAEKIKEYAKPNEKMAVWGWMNGYYILTGLLQGTQDSHPTIQIIKSNQQKYFLERYAVDLLNNKPVVFLDAVAPDSYIFFEDEYHYENYLPVKEIVDKYYTFAAEIDGKRIFLRNDRYSSMHRKR